MQRITIGIPQAMYYYEYGDIWKRFFEALGMKTLLSGKTDEEILTAGMTTASSDLCMPIKAMFGHVEKLMKNNPTPDYLFLPNIYAAGKKSYTCPKAIGSTAMIRAVFPHHPTIIAPCFYGDMRSFLLSAGKMLGFSYAQSYRAYKKAIEPFHQTPSENNDESAVIALIGHSYILKDAYLNKNIVQRLKELHISCITPYETSDSLLYKYAGNTSYKKPFWTSAGRNLGYTKYISDHGLADGIIFLNAFGCGTDALSIGFCRDYLRKHSTIPSITINLDEHNAASGLVTRMEAFADCIHR